MAVKADFWLLASESVSVNFKASSTQMQTVVAHGHEIESELMMRGVMANGKFHCFTFGLPVPIRKQGKTFIAEYSVFNISSEADSLDKLQKYVGEDLTAVFERFAFEEDAKLTLNARKLKKRLQQLIKK